MFDIETASRSQLVDYIYDLEGKVANLEAVTQVNVAAPIQVAFGIPKSQARLLAVLSCGRVLTKEQIHAGIYSDYSDGGPELKIIDVFVCKTREVLGAYGFEIKTLWGVGYQLPEDTAAAVQAVMRGENIDFIRHGNRPAIERPARLYRRANGEEINRFYAALTARADQSGIARFKSRELARETGLRRTIPALMKVLSQQGRVKVLKGSRQVGASLTDWVVQLPREGQRVAA